MTWLKRTEPQPSAPTLVPEDSHKERVERATPGVAALLDGIGEDRTHAVLDLGPASDSSLRVYGRFARWVRFADLLPATQSDKTWKAAVESLPAQPDHPYDLIFAWNILDWIEPEERRRLVEKLVAISSPEARLYVVVESASQTARSPLRFAVLDVDRMSYEPTGPPRLASSPLLPAEVERLLTPFHVSRAFTSKVGLREYVATRRRDHF